MKVLYPLLTLMLLSQLGRSIDIPDFKRIRYHKHKTQTSNQTLLLTVAAIQDEINLTISKNVSIAPKYVRLGFHDCVGGCDGCVDMSDANNRGLDIAIRELEPIVTKYKGTAGISRADIWAISALTAAEVSTKGMLNFPVNWIGRKDCDRGKKKCRDSTGAKVDCTGTNGNLPARRCMSSTGEKVLCTATTGDFFAMPSADFTTHQVLAYFADNFGFNARETVVIMGGHDLGFASRSNSGYDGAGGWHRDPTALNNGYYAALKITPWNFTFVNNSDIPSITDKYQWNLNQKNASLPPNFMLNSDMALVYDMEGYLNASTGFVSCRLDCPSCTPTIPSPPLCPLANQTNGFVVEYKLNVTKFVYDFRDAFNKMLTKGYNLSDKCPVAPCYLQKMPK